MRKLLLIPFLVLFLLPLAGVNRSHPVLEEYSRLIASKSYQSAFEYLENNRSRLNSADYVIRKTEMALYYSVSTTLLQRFAFIDIPQNHLLDDYRAQSSIPPTVAFKPDEVLGREIQKDPDNGELQFWLGQYYFEVLKQYSGEWLISDQELLNKSVNAFTSASDLGFSDPALSRSFGITLVKSGRHNEGREALFEALQAGDRFPETYHYLAAAYYYLQDPEGLEYAEEAVRLQTDSEAKADSCLLAGSLAILQQNTEKAVLFLEQGKSHNPMFYQLYLNLIGLYLQLDNPEEANNNAINLFNMYPSNPEVTSIIIDQYFLTGRIDACLTMFDALSSIHVVPEALGNIYYHKALLTDMSGDAEEAKKEMALAKEQFLKVYPADHPLFEEIDSLMASM